MAKAKDRDKTDKEIEEELEKDIGKEGPIAPNDMQAYALSHITYCLIRNYNAGGFGMNFEKDSLLGDFFGEALEYLKKFPVCLDKIEKSERFMSSARKYKTKK